MRKIWKIIKKNVKVLVRAKGSALIVIFGPLLLILLAGLAFDNSSAYSIKIGTFSENYNELANGIVAELEGAAFSVQRYKSEADCIEAIKQGKINTCMVLDKDFTVGQEGSNEISFHLDYSKINLVWMILDTVSEQVKGKSSELSIDLTNVLLYKLDQARGEIEEDKKLVVELTDGSNKASSDIATLSTNLNKLNLDMDMDDFPIKAVLNRTSLVSELAGFSSMHALDLINSIKVDLGGLNVSSGDTEGIVTLLDETKLKLENIDGKIANSTEGLEEMTQSMKASLEMLKSRFDRAGTIRGDTVQKFNELTALLDSNINTLMALQSSFNRIDSEIQNIEITDAEDIVSPIKTTIKPVTSESSHLNYIFPSLIVLVIMFISLFLSSTLVVMEKSSRAFFRNFIAPTKDIIFVIATYLTSLLFLLIQVVIILIVASFFFASQLFSGILTTLMVLILVGTLFILIGMTIGYIFKSEETSTLATISTGSIFLFLSSVILPIESMPPSFIRIAQFNPFVIAESMLRKSIIFNYSLVGIFNDVLLIISYSALFFAVIMISQKHMKRRFGLKYATRFTPRFMRKKAAKAKH